MVSVGKSSVSDPPLILPRRLPAPLPVAGVPSPAAPDPPPFFAANAAAATNAKLGRPEPLSLFFNAPHFEAGASGLRFTSGPTISAFLLALNRSMAYFTLPD